MTDGSSAAGPRPFAVVTGASTGVGYELALLAGRKGYDLLVVSGEEEIEQAAFDFQGTGVDVRTVIADLATPKGVDDLYDAAQGRPIDLLFANAGQGLGQGFLDQPVDDWRRVVETNITGTIYLVQKVGQEMRDRGAGKILIVGSIAALMPGTFQAVHNGTKAFLDSFSFALRHELKGSGVGVTCMMPGATEKDFFECEDPMDTVGPEERADSSKVARDGFDALMADKGTVVSGWQNKLQAAIAHITPDGALAELDTPK